MPSGWSLFVRLGQLEVSFWTSRKLAISIVPLAISNQHTKSHRFAPISKWASASDTQQPETTRGSISSHANKTSSALAPKSIWGSILSTFKATQIFSNQQLCTHHQQPKKMPETTEGFIWCHVNRPSSPPTTSKFAQAF